MVRMDEESKLLLVTAAQLRKVSVSDYVRMIMVEQAKREIEAADSTTIAMTPDEQMQFWNALAQPAKLTRSQKSLSQIIVRCSTHEAGETNAN